MKNIVVVFFVITLCISWCQALYISVPEDYATIQEAIDAANQGDTVLIANGEYTGSGNRDIDFRGKDITVRARSLCRINCESTLQDPHTGFLFRTSETNNARLEGFTIVNGSYGISINDMSSPTIVNCSATDCDYGLEVMADCNPTVSNCIFNSNHIYGASWGAHSRGSITNCLFTGNGEVGIGLGHIGEPLIVNCTIADNGQYGAEIEESNTIFRNCIFWNNGMDSIYQTLCEADIQYCLIEGGFPGAGNLNANPGFVAGAYGAYYLASIAGHQQYDSPCIDAGNDSASNICFATWKENICLNELTTQQTGATDVEIVDIGYHYFTDQEPASPTPTCTPTGCGITGVTIEMPSKMFSEGDPCWCRMEVCNADTTVLEDYPVVAILMIGNTLFFAPDMSAEFQTYLPDYPSLEPGLTQIEVMSPFTWPAGAGAFNDSVWYAAILTPELNGVLGEIGSWEFGWQ